VSVSVNGRAVAVGPDTKSELAAARELLRQRAGAVGLLDEDSTDKATIDRAVEELLAREVVTPAPTEEE